MKSMNDQRPQAKRIVRALTPEESERLTIARRETEADREEMLRDGRVAKQAWLAMRRDVDVAVSR